MPRTVVHGRTASQGSRERGVRCCRCRVGSTVQDAPGRPAFGGRPSAGGPSRSDGPT